MNLLRPLYLLLLASCLVPFAHGATGAAADWTTPAERAQFRTTPSYADTRAYLQRLAEAAPGTLRLSRFGVSPEGRDLMLVVAASGGEFTPQAARASGKTIVLVQAGIHAGEIEGKDAALMLLRDLAFKRGQRHLLDHTILLWLPIFNVDGHENSSPWNRINQNGPQQMGFRATAQNLNLNRDYMKADAPEMRAWLALFDAWQPDLFLDIHTTDGADYQYDLMWYMEQWGPLHPAVQRWQGEAFERDIVPAYERKRHLAAPYLELVDGGDLRKGISNFGSGPRFSTGYVALRNRAALLVETHMLKPYAVRVRAAHDFVLATLERLARDAGALRRAVTQADADTVARGRKGGASLAVAFKTSTQSVPFTLKGYAWSDTPSDISGGDWVRYDPRRPRTYVVPHYRDLVATQTVSLPAAYLVPSGWPQVVERLRLHGIRVQRIDHALELTVEHDQLDAPQWAGKPFEGHHLLTRFEQARNQATLAFAPGAVLVPLDQPLANVAINLLEPQASDSLLRWGLFDAIFEQKEYADPRVAEQIARDMLARDPALRQEFEQRLAGDTAFAASPWARLDFFYRRSPWYATQRVGAYPVVSLDSAAVASATRAGTGAGAGADPATSR